MKKLNSILAIATVALTTVFGLSSCDLSDPWQDSNNPTSNTYSFEDIDNSKKADPNQEYIFTVTVDAEMNAAAPTDAADQLAAKLKNYFQNILGIYGTVNAEAKDGKVAMTLTSTEDNKLMATSIISKNNYSSKYDEMIQNLGFVNKCNVNIKGGKFNYDFKFTPSFNYEGTWEATDAQGVKYELALTANKQAGNYKGTLTVGTMVYTVASIGDQFTAMIVNSSTVSYLRLESHDIDVSNTSSFKATISDLNKTLGELVFDKQ